MPFWPAILAARSALLRRLAGRAIAGRVGTSPDARLGPALERVASPRAAVYALVRRSEAARHARPAGGVVRVAGFSALRARIETLVRFATPRAALRILA